ncbi:MAG: bacteriophage N4 adsorption protein A [Rickettsiales bacterium]|jgi:hypothetical protein|nr:bacteriophage N4 adsorption protein A [Rickettsiales bacterium]
MPQIKKLDSSLAGKPDSEQLRLLMRYYDIVTKKTDVPLTTKETRLLSLSSFITLFPIVAVLMMGYDNCKSPNIKIGLGVGIALSPYWLKVAGKNIYGQIIRQRMFNRIKPHIRDKDNKELLKLGVGKNLMIRDYFFFRQNPLKIKGA